MKAACPNFSQLDPDLVDDAALHSLNVALEVFDELAAVDEQIRAIKASGATDDRTKARLFCLGMCRVMYDRRMGHA